MSLRRHLLANYASQIYVAAVGILVTPLYLDRLGVEAYGLIGFFAALQVWFLLLDAGLSPAVAREVARYLGNAPDAAPLKPLLRWAQTLFLVLAAVGAGGLALATEPIAQHWLNVNSLPLPDVVQGLRLMAAIAGLRLLASLYRACISGFEKLTWLGGFNTAMASAKAFLALPALAWIGPRIEVYFGVQLLVAGIEVAMLAWQLSRLLAHAPTRQLNSSLQLKRIAGVCGGVAVTTLLNVALSQSDRLLLSALLSLPDYASFSLATLAASAISLASGPLGTVFSPRLARLAGSGDTTALVQTYRLGTRLMSLAVWPAAMTMAWHAQSLILAWTGKTAVASATAPILTLYAMGNALAAMAMMPYLLQFALGRLRWHVLGSVGFIGLLIPGQWWLTVKLGATGAGIFWIGVNLAWLLLWLPVVHQRLLPDVRWRGAATDALSIAGLSAMGSCAAAWVLPWSSTENRLGLLALLLVAWLLTLLLAALCLPETRQMLRHKLRRSPPAESHLPP